MTPTGIKLGRQFDAQVTAFTLAADSAQLVAPGDGNRVAVSASISNADGVGATALVLIGPKVGNAVVPLTALTPGHPTCYLSVDKLGSLVVQPLFVISSNDPPPSVAVALIRQVQELP